MRSVKRGALADSSAERFEESSASGGGLGTSSSIDDIEVALLARLRCGGLCDGPDCLSVVSF